MSPSEDVKFSNVRGLYLRKYGNLLQRTLNSLIIRTLKQQYKHVQYIFPALHTTKLADTNFQHFVTFLLQNRMFYCKQLHQYNSIVKFVGHFLKNSNISLYIFMFQTWTRNIPLFPQMIFEMKLTLDAQPQIKKKYKIYYL